MIRGLPDVLRLDELLRFRLCLRVSDLDVVTSWHAVLLILLQAFVSVLQRTGRVLAEVVSNDTIDGRLRSVRSTISELLLGQRYLHAAAFEGAHPEWNPEIVTLPVNVILWCCDVSSDN